MLEKKWYYYLNEIKHGPFTENDLKEKFKNRELEHYTLIWKDGMISWLPAHKVESFVEVLDLPEDFYPTKAKFSKQKVFFALFTLACLVTLVFIGVNNF